MTIDMKDRSDEHLDNTARYASRKITELDNTREYYIKLRNDTIDEEIRRERVKESVKDVPLESGWYWCEDGMPHYWDDRDNHAGGWRHKKGSMALVERKVRRYSDGDPQRIVDPEAESEDA